MAIASIIQDFVADLHKDILMILSRCTRSELPNEREVSWYTTYTVKTRLITASLCFNIPLSHPNKSASLFDPLSQPGDRKPRYVIVPRASTIRSPGGKFVFATLFLRFGDPPIQVLYLLPKNLKFMRRSDPIAIQKVPYVRGFGRIAAIRDMSRVQRDAEPNRTPKNISVIVADQESSELSGHEWPSIGR